MPAYNNQKSNNKPQDQDLIPDQFAKVSFPVQEGQPWESVIVGKVIYAHNRGNKANGKPYTDHKLSINFDKLIEMVNSGRCKKSVGGWVNIALNEITDEGKSKMAASHQAGGQQGGGNYQQPAAQPQQQAYQKPAASGFAKKKPF